MVLTGLMLSVGLFYGGLIYTDSRAEIDAVKIIDISEKMKSSVKIAESRDIELTESLDYPESPDGELVPPDVVIKSPLDIMLESGVISEIPRIYKDGGGSRGNFDLLKTFNLSRFINVMKVDINEAKLCSKINELISGYPSIPKIDVSFFSEIPPYLKTYSVILMTDGGYDLGIEKLKNYTGKCFESGGVFGSKNDYVFISIFDSGMAYREFMVAAGINIDKPKDM